jgi:hypothetical protein
MPSVHLPVGAFDRRPRTTLASPFAVRQVLSHCAPTPEVSTTVHPRGNELEVLVRTVIMPG